MSNSTSGASASNSGCTGDASSLLVLQIVVAIESVVIFVGIIGAVIAASGGWDELMRTASDSLSSHASRIRSASFVNVSFLRLALFKRQLGTSDKRRRLAEREAHMARVTDITSRKEEGSQKEGALGD